MAVGWITFSQARQSSRFLHYAVAGAPAPVGMTNGCVFVGRSGAAEAAPFQSRVVKSLDLLWYNCYTK